MVEDVVFVVMAAAMMFAMGAVSMWIADIGPLASKHTKDYRRRVAKTKELVGDPADTLGNEFCEMIFNAYKHAGYHMKGDTPSQVFLVEKDGKKTVVGTNRYGLSRDTMSSVEDGMKRHGCTGAIFCKKHYPPWRVEVGFQELYELDIKFRQGPKILAWLCAIYFPAEQTKEAKH